MKQKIEIKTMAQPGDILPNLVLSGPMDESINLCEAPMAGRLNIFILAGMDNKLTSSVLTDLAENREKLDRTGAQIVVVRRVKNSKTKLLPGIGGSSSNLALPMSLPDLGERKVGAMRLFDPNNSLFDFAGISEEQIALLTIGPNQHVLDIKKSRPTAEDLDRLIQIIRKDKNLREIGTPGIHPPVLSVPNVMSKSDCDQLISIFETRGQEFVEPGHMVLGKRKTDCKMRIPDLGRRDRIDHWVVEEDTQSFISNRLKSRLFPEIYKAFNYKISRHERYRIAQYMGDRGGEQIGHRDNIEQIVAHRRFAVTINLNAEEYIGAELKFPEFSDQLYKPRSGTAIVFSCSLLHEVVGMISGTRFALLAFLFGEE